ncbi:Acyl-CoA N-acyltransferase [Penicillium odoratum]|uniref:Acyl-CoA N-acyltransferase n=1 Tax=Penicillium odoratum TaxID=1167516 RepID=UPI0025476030|nr:Acyl-CoA N-acyltransferase [Penicillium odoratum]KAJ5753132.1 Acyl-CoA N-acyltransferase [Penicillium odoratum]
MVNKSYLVSSSSAIKPLDDKTRLNSDSQLSEELGPDGFTAVAFSHGPDGKVDVIGTASMKKWKDDSLWRPYDATSQTTNLNQTCVGDFELAVVALLPGAYRGQGLAGRLVKLCEEEILRRERTKSPIRIMIRVSMENNGQYWLKQGFVPIGSKACPKGFWGSTQDFTMWAM